jgi:hypothetical protein
MHSQLKSTLDQNHASDPHTEKIRRKLPRYCRSFVDRHGHPRFYCRRAGGKNIALPGLPWSPEFMAAYEVAMTEQPIQWLASEVGQWIKDRPVRRLKPAAKLPVKPAWNEGVK